MLREAQSLVNIYDWLYKWFPHPSNFSVCLDPLGLMTCESGNKELKVKLLELKLEALVKSKGKKEADQALESFSQVF